MIIKDTCSNNSAYSRVYLISTSVELLTKQYVQKTCLYQRSNMSFHHVNDKLTYTCNSHMFASVLCFYIWYVKLNFKIQQDKKTIYFSMVPVPTGLGIFSKTNIECGTYKPKKE